MHDRIELKSRLENHLAKLQLAELLARATPSEDANTHMFARVEAATTPFERYTNPYDRIEIGDLVPEPSEPYELVELEEIADEVATRVRPSMLLAEVGAHTVVFTPSSGAACRARSASRNAPAPARESMSTLRVFVIATAVLLIAFGVTVAISLLAFGG